MTDVVDATLPILDTAATLENQPFWDAIGEGRFVLPRCRECGLVLWYPRGFCSVCARTDTVEWFPASGRGRIYSYTIIRKGRGPWSEVAPYVAAYVELDEGPRVMTNIVGCDPEAVAIDQPVELVIEADQRGRRIYRFRPDPDRGVASVSSENP